MEIYILGSTIGLYFNIFIYFYLITLIIIFNPERDLYYLGGKVIEVLSMFSQQEVDYFELYFNVNKMNKISINLYKLIRLYQNNY